MADPASPATAAPECAVSVSPLLHALRAAARGRLPEPAAPESDDSPASAGPTRAPAGRGAAGPGVATATPGLGGRGEARSDPAPFGAASGPAAEGAAAEGACARAPRPAWTPLCLRRDGERPLAFHGTLLLRLAVRTPDARADRCATADAPSQGDPSEMMRQGDAEALSGEAEGHATAATVQTLDVFATRAGPIVAAIRAEADGLARFRPVFRARIILAAADFEAFLAEYDPGAAAGMDSRLAHALRADFARLVGESGLAPGCAAGKAHVAGGAA